MSAGARDPIAAALGPLDDREPAHSLPRQPGPLLAGGKLDICLGPLPRPVVFGPVERGRAEPVRPGELWGVVYAQPALFGGVHEHQSTERPEGLPAERRGGLLVEDDHPAAGVSEFGSGHQAGEAGPDDHDVRVHAVRTA